MNDSERSDWIDNDEGLYDYWIKSKLPKRNQKTSPRNR